MRLYAQRNGGGTDGSGGVAVRFAMLLVMFVLWVAVMPPSVLL